MEDLGVLIDGSFGEGGGQIVRSSLALALVTGRPVQITNIRAKRSKPGLAQQHMTALRAAAEVGRGRITGDAVGSKNLSFEPTGICHGEFDFRVGTAGSASLVLQTVLPALLIADGPSRLQVHGGTHNLWAPPFEFLSKSFLPLVNRLGPQVATTLHSHGFYPAGGGSFSLNIQPTERLGGFELLQRGDLLRRTVVALIAQLPTHIAQRELDTIARTTNRNRDRFTIDEIHDATGPGNVVLIELAFEHVTEVFCGFGRRGVRAERVARDVLRDAQDYEKSGVPVGPYLADQLLLPLAISAWQGKNDSCQSGSAFRTAQLSEHARTQIHVIQEFLDVDIVITESDSTTEVRVQ